MQRVVSVLEAVDQLWRKVLENDGSDHEEKRRFRAAKRTLLATQKAKQKNNCRQIRPLHLCRSTRQPGQRYHHLMGYPQGVRAMKKVFLCVEFKHAQFFPSLRPPWWSGTKLTNLPVSFGTNGNDRVDEWNNLQENEQE
jgi:hypothetical protein